MRTAFMSALEDLAVRLFKEIAFPENARRRRRMPSGDLRDFVRTHYEEPPENVSVYKKLLLKTKGRVNVMAEEEKNIEKKIEETKQEIEKAGEGDIPMKEVDKLKKDLDSLRKDLKDLTGSVRDLTVSKATSAKEKVWRTASDIEDRATRYATDAYDTVRDQSERYLNMGREQIQNRPLTSALWIFAAGFLMGKLFDRR
jgi:ElaB/YqjD/DUF883 family membrane-anchored ribosome-binding protein